MVRALHELGDAEDLDTEVTWLGDHVPMVEMQEGVKRWRRPRGLT